MSTKTVIINNKYLFDILNEINQNLNFKIIDGLSKNFSYENLDNYLIITTKDESIKKDQVIISNFPIKLKKLIEIINVNFLKKNYTSQSSIKISNYILDLNSRTLNSNKSKLVI